MTPVSNERVSADEIERIILDTEPESMSAKGDKVWTRRMAEALASRLALRSQSPEPSSSVRVKPLLDSAPETLWCESCGEAEQAHRTEHAGLCDGCWRAQGQPT